MISNEQIEQKKKGLTTQVEQYETLKFHKSYRGIASILIAIFSLFVLWSNVFLAISLLPLIWLVAKGRRWAMITASIYVVLLDFVLIANYIENNRNTSGDFVSSLTPVYFYLILGGIIIRYTLLALKVEKIRKLQKNS